MEEYRITQHSTLNRTVLQLINQAEVGHLSHLDLILPRVYAEDPWASFEKGRGT